jgi:hypothetical protein
MTKKEGKVGFVLVPAQSQKKERKSKQALPLFALPHILSILFFFKKKTLMVKTREKIEGGILKPSILVGDLKEDAPSGVIQNLKN